MRIYSPIVSNKYGFSMLRIDIDEETLYTVGVEILSEGLPLPPAISIIPETMEIKDPILDEGVSLQPTGGRSATIY